MSSRLRYACIGAGGIADKKHLNKYSKMEQVELVAICDANPAAALRLAEKYGVSITYTDFSKMINELELDFVSVCTPNYMHAPITIACLEKGLHVHCEKPLSINATEAKAILEAKNKSGKKVMVALNNRFTYESCVVKKFLEQGYLGEIYHAKCGWRRRNGIPGKGMWFSDKQLAGGGTLIDLGVHFLDLVMFFMKYPKAISVSASTYSKFANMDSRLRPGYKSNGAGKYDVEDMALGLVRLQDGATIDFEFSWASNIEKETKYYELLGTKGGISFKNDELKIYSEILGTSVDITPSVEGIKEGINEFQHFVDSIINNEETYAPAEEAFELMKIIDAAYTSALMNKEVVI